MVRVSGKSQIDRTGIPRQLEEIDRICNLENLIVKPGDEYRYPALSGADVEKNPKFRAMLQRLEEPNIAGIVLSDISRLFRPEFADNLAISKPFRVNGKLIFYEGGVLDLRNQRDIDTFINLARAAGAHRLRIIKDTQWGRNRRRQNGDCKTDPLPPGVEFVPHPKTDPTALVVGHFKYTHDIRSDRVVTAFRRIAIGDAQAVVARELGFASPGKLRQTLRSRWWIGEKHSAFKREGAMMRDDGTKYDGERKPRTSDDKNAKPVPANFIEPPLIAIDLWNAVQAKLDDRQKTWTQVKDKTNPAIEACLGRGILYCECGKKMMPKRGRGAGKADIMYYMCSSGNNYGKRCGRPVIRQEIVDRQLRTLATMRLTNLEYLKTLAPAQRQTDTQMLDKRLALLKRKLLANMSKMGEVDDEDMLTMLRVKIEKEIREVEHKLRTQPKPMAFNPSELRKEYLRFAQKTLAEQKDLLKRTFAKVPIDGEGSILLAGLVMATPDTAWKA
jgi:hypothetical protein